MPVKQRVRPCIQRAPSTDGNVATVFKRPLWQPKAHKSLNEQFIPALLRSNVQIRSSTTSSNLPPKVQRLSPAQHQELLAAQRLSRPVTPHLSIYQPQIHWVSGGIMRNASVIIAAPVYIFGAAYLAAPLMGWHLDSASLVEWFGGLSYGTRLTIKGVFGFPFVFHIVHGLKHLIWDTGAMYTRKQVWISGWVGMGISVIGTIGLMVR